MPSIGTHKLTYYTHNNIPILYKHIVHREGICILYIYYHHIYSHWFVFSLSVSPWLCNFRSLLYWEIIKNISTYACTIGTIMYLVKLVILLWCVRENPNILRSLYYIIWIKLCNSFFLSFVILFIFSHTLGIRSSQIIINVGHLETHRYDYYYNIYYSTITTTTAAVVAAIIYIHWRLGKSGCDSVGI